MRAMVRLGIVVLLAGCGTDPAAPAVPDAPPPALAPTCNPVIGDDCLTPFPSSYFEVAAPTATAVQVALPADALPKTRGGLVIRPDRLNATDGFSPSTLFLAYFAAGVDASALPGYADPAASVTA